jgi:hypothetical protein
MRTPFTFGSDRLAALVLLLALGRPGAFAAEPANLGVTESGPQLRFQGQSYSWEWSRKTDVFQLSDTKGRRMMRAKLQPEVVVQNGAGARQSEFGRLAEQQWTSNSLAVRYTNRTGTASVSVTVRFDPAAVWLEPIRYETTSSNEIIELRYFSENEKPNLACEYAVIPGLAESAGVSPVVAQGLWLEETAWLGRGGPPSLGLRQQWGLPVHYFCGFDTVPRLPSAGTLKAGLSEAFCLGLADLPAGDLLLKTTQGSHSLIVNIRSDLWHQLRGQQSVTLGAKLLFAFGSDFRAAIGAYYARLVEVGIIEVPRRSAHKEAVMASPEFNTYGDQVATGLVGPKLTEQALTGMYDGLRALGLRPGMFVIDAKWEGSFGNLQHSAERFPHFAQFLDRVRQDGLKLGMWAAFMRCENPAELGLTLDHMLRGTDGKPIKRIQRGVPYYLLDFTQPEVQTALRERARRFIRTYHPDLVKFDFGYELPSLTLAAPKDMNYAGERMMLKGLEVVVGAMREENPDVVLMYYQLSPLFTKYIDLHSPDDPFLYAGEYDLGINRCLYFSSLLADLGTPTYGSGGYDWQSMPQIWFDSALLGTVGLLQSLGPDERGETATPERVAKFNGVCQVVRPASRFHIEVLGDQPVFAPTRAAHATSWARFEGNELVGVALRDRAWQRAGIAATAPLVVASRESAGLHRAQQLALVPFGEGELTLQHEAATGRFTVRRHLLGGATEAGSASIANGVLKVPFKEQGDNGQPVEWLEINLGERQRPL